MALCGLGSCCAYNSRLTDGSGGLVDHTSLTAGTNYCHVIVARTSTSESMNSPTASAVAQ